MAAISATTSLQTRQDKDVSAMLILEAVSTYKGARAKLNGPTHATAAHQGRVEGVEATIDAGSIPWGVFDKAGFGTNGALVGDESEVVEQVCAMDSYVRERVAVTGASAQADVGTVVYMTNNNDLTLTRPTNGLPCGVIQYYYSATSFDVRMFSVNELLVLALSGAAKETICLGAIAPVLTANGNLLTGWVAPYHGKILSSFAICVRGPTDLDVDIDVNLEIGAVDVTGGVIKLVTADVAGNKKVGTAITALNVFHEGDAIDVEGVVNIAGAIDDPGLYNLYIVVEKLPGV